MGSIRDFYAIIGHYDASGLLRYRRKARRTRVYLFHRTGGTAVRAAAIDRVSRSLAVAQPMGREAFPSSRPARPWGIESRTVHESLISIHIGETFNVQRMSD